MEAFHLIGIDVLIDAGGRPLLLELNSAPSMAIRADHPDGRSREGTAAAAPLSPHACSPLPQLSPVDTLVKRAVQYLSPP